MTVKKKTKPQAKPKRAANVQAVGNHLSAPELFFQKLRARLAALGLDVEAMDTKTSLDNPPPCFSFRGSSYAEWLAAAANAEPPIRLDMPLEPAYCRDCSRKFQKTAIKAKACLFPHIRFEREIEFGEHLHVGQTHSRIVSLDESGIDTELFPAISA